MHRKHFISLFLVVMFAVVPYLSYHFLKGGYNYRMQTLSEIKDKTKISDTVGLGNLNLNRKVTWVVINGREDIVKGIYNQFGKVEDFNLISTADYGIPQDSNFILFSVQDSSLINLTQHIKTDTKYLVIDDSLYIRKQYTSHDDVKNMVKHLATLIPFVEKNKFKSK